MLIILSKRRFLPTDSQCAKQRLPPAIVAASVAQWVWGGGRGSDVRSVVVDKGRLPPAQVAARAPQRVWGGGRGSDVRSVVVDKGRLPPAQVAARAPQWGRSGSNAHLCAAGWVGGERQEGFGKYT